ncbi:MAG TPA: hypothetical protein PLC61_06875 [Chitinophagales bacterium]|nr:hypothetical protein [Chitinophagales bacterium]HMU99054.1 hypothetical protein [Chitinophagales bacterium]HMV03528.1 hypothetical protein [Chitinophagales bacterium]HMW95349.1 hypothetical protein [Chitinophagales bacterium]HMY43374.1 hypothetical protein [Chitinophagales bacterium]
MKTSDIFIAHPQTNEQVSALKAFMKALNIKFEIAKSDAYKSEFVAKIKNSEYQISEGNFTEVSKKDLQSFIDNL